MFCSGWKSDGLWKLVEIMVKIIFHAVHSDEFDCEFEHDDPEDPEDPNDPDDLDDPEYLNGPDYRDDPDDPEDPDDLDDPEDPDDPDDPDFEDTPKKQKPAIQPTSASLRKHKKVREDILEKNRHVKIAHPNEMATARVQCDTLKLHKRRHIVKPRECPRCGEVSPNPLWFLRTILSKGGGDHTAA